MKTGFWAMGRVEPKVKGNSKFQRRHYEAIAKVLRSEFNGGLECEFITLLIVMDKLVEMFAEDNPAFDSDKFIRACKLAPEV